MESTVESKKNPIIRNAANYGAMIGVTLVIMSLILYVFNVTSQNISQYLNLALILAGIIIGILNYRNNINGGFISYAKSLGSGVLIGLFASVVLAIYTFIFAKFIDPGMIDEIMKKAEESILEKNPSISDEQLELALSYTRKFTSPAWMAVSSVLSLTFVSFIISLIVSIFTRKEDKSFESNFN